MARKNPCTICGKPGIPGLLRGQGKCQEHWTAGVWGQAWADKVHKPKERLIGGFEISLRQGKIGPDALADELVRIASMLREGYQEGEVLGDPRLDYYAGWWKSTEAD